MGATFTLANSIMSANSIDYEITSGAQHIETFSQAAVTSSTAEPTCPTTFAFSVINQDSSAIDTAVFTYVGATSVFTIETSDNNKIASYDLRIQAKYFETSCNPVCSGATPCKDDTTDVCSAYVSDTTCGAGTTDCSTVAVVTYSDAGTYDFTVNVIDSCRVATLAISSSTLSAISITYGITSGAPQTETFLQSAVTPTTAAGTNCPTTYAFTVINQDTTAIES